MVDAAPMAGFGRVRPLPGPLEVRSLLNIRITRVFGRVDCCGGENERMEVGPTQPIAAKAAAATRAAPPDATLGWLLGVLDAAEVVETEVMRGGSTSALHRVTVRLSGGEQLAVVLRRYVLEEVLAETPDVVSHEVTALRLAASAAVATPQVLAADANGEHTDAPTVVMSWLGGRPRWEAKDRRRFLIDMADAMLIVLGR